MSSTDQAWQYLQQFAPGQYVQWHIKRMVTSIDYLASQVDLKGLKVLDLGHDPLMGLLMVRTGMTLTGNLAPGSKDLCRFTAGDGRAIEWASDEFDFEGRFPYPDHSFDLVTGFEIIEHVRDNPRAVLREIKRVLKPGGLAYLGTPNVNSWSKLMRQFRGDRLYDSMPYSNEYGPRHFMCHVYEYSPYELKQFLRSEGFALVHARTWDVYPDDEKPLRKWILLPLMALSLALTGYFKEAALLFKDRGHQMAMIFRRP